MSRQPSRSAGRRPRVALRVAIALGLAAAAAPAPAAEAGTYTVHACRAADGRGAALTDWRVTEGRFVSILTWRDRCASGGAFELEMSGAKTHPSDHYIAATLRAPADTAIVGYQLWRSVQLGTDFGYRIQELTRDGRIDLDGCYAAQGCGGKGDASSPLAGGNLVRYTGRDLHALEVVLTCALSDSSTAKCPTGSGARLQLHRADVTLADNASPVIETDPTGPLVQSGLPLTGAQPVSISATDRGGGVYLALFEVDGRVVAWAPIDSNGGQCRAPFTVALPCKPSASGTVALDTSRLADGAHSLRILVTDVTGTNMAAWGPISIRTANRNCNPRPRVRSPDVKVRLAGRRGRKARRITIRYGRKLRVRGRLVGPGRAPVPGAAVCVVARDSMVGASLRAYRTLATASGGGFSYVLRPGASRRVHFVHRVPGGAASGSVLVRVRAPVSLRGSARALRNGQTLVMRGALRAPPYPRRGALVELQARRGSGWQTFATTRTNRRGRFSYRYTFSRTQGVQRYALRARVPAQATYPFAAGGSRPLRVRVIG